MESIYRLCYKILVMTARLVEQKNKFRSNLRFVLQKMTKKLHRKGKFDQIRKIVFSEHKQF